MLDPSFHGSGLDATARVAGVAVKWHPGYALTADALAGMSELSRYRGEVVADRAIALAQDGLITPAILGASRRGGREDPQLQKWIWHCLARFGAVDRRLRSTSSDS